MKNKIEHVIKKIHDKCLEYIDKDEYGNVVVRDKFENGEVGIHYAMTHTAVGLILSGKKGNSEDYEMGMSLLNGILSRWELDSKKVSFHHDFNSFALCIIENNLKHNVECEEICERIRRVVLNTIDSNHDTVNWLPMRIFVNHCRYLWTSNEKYNILIKKLEKKIQKATYEDGFIDDRLPKGKSYNLQYNLATVACLMYMKENGREYVVEKNLEALINVMSPDGDINYLGRGCNQIFAWGPWLYLLKASGQNEYFEKSFIYFYENMLDAAENDNLLMNKYEGEEKYLWWDYHYISVYMGHIYMWMQLMNMLPTKSCEKIEQKEIYGSDSGISIKRNEKFFVCLFNGRDEYLSEGGPAIYALWTKKYGYIVKGEFGPWKGLFGNKHSSPIILFNNFMPLVTNENKQWIFHRLVLSLGKNEKKIKIRFPIIRVEMREDEIILKFDYKRKRYSFFNMVTINSNEKIFEISADNKKVEVRKIGMIKNQYEYVHWMQSESSNTRIWQCVIRHK